jgi:hypothetical protein
MDQNRPANWADRTAGQSSNEVGCVALREQRESSPFYDASQCFNSRSRTRGHSSFVYFLAGPDRDSEISYLYDFCGCAVSLLGSLGCFMGRKSSGLSRIFYGL